MIKNLLNNKSIQYIEKEDKKTNLRFKQPFFYVLITVWLLMFIAIVIILPIVGNKPQVYDDMIIESTAMTNTNKLGEIKIFWYTLFLACISTIGIIQFLNSKNKNIGYYYMSFDETINKWPVFKFICITLIPNILLLIFTGNIISPLLFSTSVYCIVDIFYEKYSLKIVMLFAFLYYSLTGIIAFLNKILIFTPISKFVVKSPEISITQVRIFVLFIGTIISLFCLNKGDGILLNKILIFLQCIIPLNLMVYLINTYKFYDNSITKTEFDIGYKVFIYAIILCLYVYIFFKNIIISIKNKNVNSKDLIFLSTIITIFIFNSYLLPAQFFQIDGHHHGEQMMAWNQIVKHGLTPYKYFFPASGLYSMATGFIQNILLNGSVTVYAAAESLLMVIFAIITIVLCYFNAGPIITLIISIFFSIPVYNRAYMILPSLLTLSMPSIIKKRNFWLQLYVVLSFLSGLYYPLYGAALLVGGFPFACIQLIFFIKSGDFKASYKNMRFFITWGIILISILLNIPLLIGILKYMRTTSSQTILADGIAVFSGLNNVPSNFFPYINHQIIRLVLYYGMRFSIPIVFIMIMVLILYLFLINKNYRFSEKVQTPVFFGFTSMIIVTIISYTYTIVRADINALMAREANVIITISIFLIIMLYKYGYLILNKAKVYIMIGIILGFSLMLYRSSFIAHFPNVAGTKSVNGGFTDDMLKLKFAYDVPEGYVLSDGSIQSIGKGYIPSNLKENYLKTIENIRYLNLDDDFIVNFGSYQDYSLFNVKALDTGPVSLSKSKKSQDRVIELMKEKRPAISHLNSYINYYIYRWMINEGYVKTTKGFYMPPEKVNDKDIVQGWKFTGDTFSTVDLGNIPNSLGKSMKSLRRLFAEYKLENKFNITSNNLKKMEYEKYVITNADNSNPYLQIDFNQKIKGLDADYLYIELETDAFNFVNLKPPQSKFINYFSKNTIGENFKIALYWTNGNNLINDNKMFNFNYGDGHILLALGANTRWLLEENDKIQIHFLQQFNVGSTVKINDIKFLKLN